MSDYTKVICQWSTSVFTAFSPSASLGGMEAVLTGTVGLQWKFAHSDSNCIDSKIINKHLT